MVVTFSETASALRHELASGASHGPTELAELASRHANNRDLVYRAVLLKRELTRTQEAPTSDQIRRGVEHRGHRAGTGVRVAVVPEDAGSGLVERGVVVEVAGQAGRPARGGERDERRVEPGQAVVGVHHVDDAPVIGRPGR